MVLLERSAIVVRGHRPLRVPQEAVSARLTSTMALVLSTYRSDDPDMVVDHELWLACMEVVREVVGATTSEVFLEPKRRFLEQFRRRRRGTAAGTLENYSARVHVDCSIKDWDTIIWREGTAIVAAATCERWYLVGGPALYHDSYTTSIFLTDSDRQPLVDALQNGVARTGGHFEGVVDAVA